MRWPPPTTPTGHAPQKEGGVTNGEGEGDRLLKKHRRRAAGDATQGEGRSLKGEQQGPLRGRHVNLRTTSQTQPNTLPRRLTGGDE